MHHTAPIPGVGMAGMEGKHLHLRQPQRRAEASPATGPGCYFWVGGGEIHSDKLRTGRAGAKRFI